MAIIRIINDTDPTGGYDNSSIGGGGGEIVSPVTITTTVLSTGNVGSSYLDYFNAADGYPLYTWARTSGSLPPGILLDENGVLSGTPTTAGTYTFTVRVTDSVNGTDSKSFTLIVEGSVPPTIVTNSLPSVLVGTAYNQPVVATGGTPPYTSWSVSFGSLPAGLLLNPSTGDITGTPTVPGNYSFTIQVTDTNSLTDIQILSIVVQALTPGITTSSLADGIAGTLYSSTISAIGGTRPYLTWEIIAGQLPAGLSLVGYPTNAIVTGTPTTTGSFPITVKVTDSLGGIDTQVLNINIYDGQFPVISTTVLPDGQIGALYNGGLIAAGGSLPYVWSIISGELPPGLELDAFLGLITGTPTSNGSYVFTIRVSDANGNSDVQLVSIVIGSYSLPSILTNKLSNVTVGSTYISHIQVRGGTGPYLWGITGTLPTGLILDVNTGLISGIPTVAGTYSFSISVEDKLARTDVKSFSITVGALNQPIIVTTSIPDADLSVLYNQRLIATGGVPGYTWSISDGDLPEGITLSPNGILSGIPKSIGIFNFTISAVDYANNEDEQVYSIIVKSTGFDSSCCICVFTGDIVNFSHNATNGVLTATGGTILTNHKWQAPFIEGFYNVIISVEGINGTFSVKNTVNVIQKLELRETSSSINHLLPKDSFRINTNYPSEMVSWVSFDPNHVVVTPTGSIFINTDAGDKCFGAIETILRGTLTGIDTCNITSFVDVKVKVNPIYPTPDNCGPPINKWVRESPDFRVITTEFEGGCDETHIRNTVPIVKWNIDYTGLRNIIDDRSICPNCKNCGNPDGTPNNRCICNDTVNTYTTPVSPNSDYSYNADCPSSLRTSNRLDDFWNLVYGQYKTFTLIDDDTQEVWYNVRFADKLSVDHTHRRTSTTRTSRLVWKPCCNKTPAGGTCSKHGIINYKSSRFDTVGGVSLPPTPTNPLINDLLNTFGWTTPAGYSLSDIEYTLDGGVSFTDALTNPINVGNANFSLNKVGVRIKATGSRLASNWLFNNKIFTFVDLNDTTPPTGAITAPTANSTIFGTYVFKANAYDLNRVGSVEFFIDGISIGSDNRSPYTVSFDTTTLTDGSHSVYATITDSSSNHNTFDTQVVSFSTLQYTTPPPPTSIGAGAVDDILNTFTFIPSTGIPVNQHEYSLNAGSSYQDVTGTSPVISVGNIAYAIGDVRVRVKANPTLSRNVSNYVANAAVFTTVANCIIITPSPLPQATIGVAYDLIIELSCQDDETVTYLGSDVTFETISVTYN